MIDFTGVKAVTIPEGSVSRILSSGVVLWKKAIYKKELLYLESNTDCRINTDISGGSDKLSFDFKFNRLGFQSYGGIFGNFVNDASNCYRLISTNADNGQFYASASSAGNRSTVLTMTKQAVHTVHMEKGKAVVNGTTISMYTTQGTANSTKVALFASNTAGGTYRNVRLYYFKISDNGVLVRDFIPVLDWNDKPCLYDKVTDELFYNQGTGEFLYG